MYFYILFTYQYGLQIYLFIHTFKSCSNTHVGLYNIWAWINLAWKRSMDKGKTNYIFTFNFVWRNCYFMVIFL